MQYYIVEVPQLNISWHQNLKNGTNKQTLGNSAQQWKGSFDRNRFGRKIFERNKRCSTAIQDKRINLVMRSRHIDKYRYNRAALIALDVIRLECYTRFAIDTECPIQTKCLLIGIDSDLAKPNTKRLQQSAGKLYTQHNKVFARWPATRDNTTQTDVNAFNGTQRPMSKQSTLQIPEKVGFAVAQPKNETETGNTSLYWISGRSLI